MKVLIAEDDKLIRQGLATLLQQEGYEPVEAENGATALQLFRDEQPEFVLLDIMMPQMDGYSVCKAIRQDNAVVPVIFISAKSEEIDRVVGLELGADDFIMKPFGTREVIARIRAVTRRALQNADSNSDPTNETPVPIDDGFVMRDITVKPKELRAYRGDTVIELSLREVKILQLLFQHAGEVVDRDALFNYCWGRDYLPSSRTLDQHISKLRKLVENDSQQPDIIETVHGVGYRFIA